MKQKKRDALFGLLGAPVDRPQVGYGIEVNVAGTDEWRLVTTEPLLLDQDAALARVQALNTALAQNVDHLSALSGIALADLVHGYRVGQVYLDYPDTGETEGSDEDDLGDEIATEFERKYGPTVRQIEQAVVEAGVRVNQVVVMSHPLGRIDVLLPDPDRETRTGAETALAALVTLGYTGYVQTTKGWDDLPDVYQPVLTGPFPLIPGS